MAACKNCNAELKSVLSNQSLTSFLEMGVFDMSCGVVVNPIFRNVYELSIIFCPLPLFCVF